MTHKVLRLQDVIHACNISRSSIYKGMKDGTFPKSGRLGTRMVGWNETQINEWIEDRFRERDEAMEGNQ